MRTGGDELGGGPWPVPTESQALKSQLSAAWLPRSPGGSPTALPRPLPFAAGSSGPAQAGGPESASEVGALELDRQVPGVRNQGGARRARVDERELDDGACRAHARDAGVRQADGARTENGGAARGRADHVVRRHEPRVDAGRRRASGGHELLQDAGGGCGHHGGGPSVDDRLRQNDEAGEHAARAARACTGAHECTLSVGMCWVKELLARVEALPSASEGNFTVEMDSVGECSSVWRTPLRQRVVTSKIF